jgi:hypothetical protein
LQHLAESSEIAFFCAAAHMHCMCAWHSLSAAVGAFDALFDVMCFVCSQHGADLEFPIFEGPCFHFVLLYPAPAALQI